MTDTDENQFYKPGVISFSEEGIAQSYKSGAMLAEQLQEGITSLLPGAVLDFLTDHSVAINSKATGKIRQEIADLMVEPHTVEQARNVASGIIDLIEKSEESLIQFTMTEIEARGRAHSIREQLGIPPIAE